MDKKWEATTINIWRKRATSERNMMDEKEITITNIMPNM